MKLKRLFPSIVQGVLLGGALQACATPQGPERTGSCETTWDGPSQVFAPESKEDPVAVALRGIRAERPDATPSEQLRALYADRATRIVLENGLRTLSPIPLTTQTLALIREAGTQEGQLTQEMCEFLCTNISGALQEGKGYKCHLSDTAQNKSLWCSYEREVCHPAGRRFEGLEPSQRVVGAPLGAAWAHIAYSERAAVHAFAALAHELTTHDAPRDLVEECLEAVFDELVHAQLTLEMARRHGAVSLATPESHATTRARGLLEIALENAAEGCIREAYAALETTWQASRLSGEAGRVFAKIATDETRHAELSWRVHNWLMSRLSCDARAEVHDTMRRARVQLAEDLSARSPVWADERLGLPDTAQALELLDQMCDALPIAA